MQVNALTMSLQKCYTNDAGQPLVSDNQLDQLSHMGNATFTKEQYEQNLQMIKKNNSVNISGDSTNITSTVISTYLASFDSQK